MATSTALGPAHEIDLPGGRIRYHETGEGAPVVFAHGLLVNADLWRKVVPVVAAAGYRCITPDWPLGSHSIPMPHADLTPPGVADLMAAFLEKLDLNDVTWVANDTGGALTQILLTQNPDRIGRVVLASVDSYDSFFPGALKALTLLAKIPGSMRPMTEVLRIRALHSLSIAFGMAAKYPMPPEAIDSYLLPSRNSGAIRKDLRRFVKSVKSSYTLDAAKRFGAVRQPVLLAWAAQDRFFPVSYAERLAMDLPNATLRLIDDSYTFLPEDQPELLAEAILEFTRLHATP
ncbi:alpha/beta fold hydrolase [Nocardia arthritidis]|uniref:Alpha/beta fold hydrolase n=1 Tax=Nocardia arthritidis TaxID=228602 RepID=A0A6G9YBF3_9NOCA|nr:alpha/beta hydrolase [Nocardia arthritidis]QIS10386.1 alpha/beta fold hydrolase [Nocardia arthritidis]